jgi:hypothetical protein
VTQTNIIEDLTLLPMPAWWQNPWVLTAMALGLLGILGLTWRYWPKPTLAPPAAPVPSGPPEDLEALERLSALRQKLSSLGHYALSIEVSDVLRDYVAARFGLPVKFQTTREFLDNAAQNESLNKTDREELGKFLGFCDQVKFAKGEASLVQQTQLLDTAVGFVKSTARPRTT